MKLRLYDANQAMAKELLKRQEIDLAITELEGQAGDGNSERRIVAGPVGVARSGKSLCQVCARDFEATASETLIALPDTEALTKLFRRGLNAQDLVWPISIEAGSLELVAPYVAAGFGIAISVLAPGGRTPAKTRALPLRGFPKLVVAALWRGKLPPIAESFLELLRAEARTLRD